MRKLMVEKNQMAGKKAAGVAKCPDQKPATPHPPGCQKNHPIQRWRRNFGARMKHVLRYNGRSVYPRALTPDALSNQVLDLDRQRSHNHTFFGQACESG
jgi:hypothetical protein